MRFSARQQKLSRGNYMPLPHMAGHAHTWMLSVSSVSCSPRHVSGERLRKTSRKKGEAMQQAEASHPFWRQGDIYFVKIDEAVNLSEGTALKNGVIARGEETGHAHRVSPSSLAACAMLVALGHAM